MESRGQGFQSNYISYMYEFMGEDQEMPPLPGRRGTRRSLWKRAAAGLDELELEPWVSLWSNHFGEESTPPLAWTEGNKMPQTPGLRRGTRRAVSGQNKQPLHRTLNSISSGRGSRCYRRCTGGEELGVPERPNPLRRRSSLQCTGSTRVLRRLLGWFSVGCDPATRMRLCTRIDLSRPFD